MSWSVGPRRTRISVEATFYGETLVPANYADGTAMCLVAYEAAS